MAKKTETQKLQECADEIWGKGKMEISHEPFVGFWLSATDAIDVFDPSMDTRLIGRDSHEAHAELDAMADLVKEQAQRENAIRGL